MPHAPLAGSSATRLLEFREKLTALIQPEGSSQPFRVVKSSGGAAGGVVSEGQGYGLLLAGVTLSTQTPGSTYRCNTTIKIAISMAFSVLVANPREFCNLPSRRTDRRR